VEQREKCVQAAAMYLEEEVSVVVDNTNADAETRAVWINPARKLDCPIRCIVFTASARVCEHNDTFRALHVGQETNPEKRSLLPRVAFSSFASRYRAPEVSEGFNDMIVIDFRVGAAQACRVGCGLGDRMMC